MKSISQTEFAKFYGVSQPMVSKYIRDGKIPPESLVKEGKYTRIIPDLAIEHLERNLDPGQRKKPAKPKRKPRKKPKNPTPEEKVETIKSADFENLDFNEARTENERYKAALKKLEYEEKTGKLIDAEEVQRVAFNAGRAMRDAVLSIPARIDALLAAETNQYEVNKLLTAELRQALEALSVELRTIEVEP